MYKVKGERGEPGTVPTKKYPGKRAYRKGCSGQQVYTSDAKPYKATGKNKTKSMKEVYAEMPRRETKPDMEARKLRKKLAGIKMPMPTARTRNENPKKTRAARRPRRVIWASERKAGKK